MESGETDWRQRKLSANFAVADLLQAGETWVRTRVSNEPFEPATLEAFKRICDEILEPVRARFGAPVITYGFASKTLTGKIKSEAIKQGVHSRISPADDQHAGHERKRNGDPVCKHLGQAVDFYVPGVSSAELALWVAENLSFDSLYFYGADKPMHVSVGPGKRRSMQALLPGKNGRRMPRSIKEAWLQAHVAR